MQQVTKSANNTEPAMGLMANLTYIVRQDAKPFFESSRLTGGIPKIYFRTEQRPATIYDMRHVIESLSMDVNGFELHNYPSKVKNLYDDEAIEQDYNTELEKMLKLKTGADLVKIFDHTRRSSDSVGADNTDGKRLPADRVHADYTITSGPQRAKDTLGEGEFNRILSSEGRIIQVNVWRPIKGPVRCAPLALADASTVPSEDLIATDQRFPDRVGEIYQLAYGAGHQWYYASEMKPEEVILIKGWDSVDDGRARFTPHGAFNHPEETPAMEPRESIETRTFLVFDSNWAKVPVV